MTSGGGVFLTLTVTTLVILLEEVVLHLFRSTVPVEVINAQGDWQSLLLYLRSLSLPIFLRLWRDQLCRPTISLLFSNVVR